MKNERGFTLVEMVISLGVIALIGTLLLQSIVSINANTKTADLMSFFDQQTRMARESFDAYPNEILSSSSLTDEHAPFNDMYPNNISENEKKYSISYTKNLKNTISDRNDEQYKMEITFVGTDKTTATGFSFAIKSFQMETKVYEKLNDGQMGREPIYTKTFIFDHVTVQQFETLGEVKKITYHGNGGCIVSSSTSTTCIGTSVQKEYNQGDSIFAPSIDGAIPSAQKNDAIFIGWSLEPNSRTLVSNSYRVQEDDDLYAQYLDKNQYRLEFSISGSERFNLDGITGEEATKPYYVENKLLHTPVKVSDMDANISNFFVNNAVIKNGHQFQYWEDKNGNEVTPDTLMETPYMVLYPHFEPLENGDQEVLSVNLTLDLTNVSAGNNSFDNSERLFAVYPFTKMEYEVGYDRTSDAFTITQTERFSGDYGSWTGMSDGQIMSTKTFHMQSDKNQLYLTVGNEKYNTLTAYINAMKKDPEHSFSIGDIRLKVKMPTFHLGDYYDSGNPYDILKTNTSTLTKDEASRLLDGTDKATFEFKMQNGKQLPMVNSETITALNQKVAEMTENKGTFTNVGSVRFESSGNVSYDSYTIQTTEPGIALNVIDNHITEVDYTFIIPASTIMFQNTLKAGNVDIYIKDGYIWVDIEIRFSNGGNAFMDVDKLRYNTGIPFREKQGKIGPNGEELWRYYRITNFIIAGDASIGPGSFNLFSTEVTTHKKYVVNNKASWYPEEVFNGIYENKYTSDDIDEFNRDISITKGGQIGVAIYHIAGYGNCPKPYEFPIGFAPTRIYSSCAAVPYQDKYHKAYFTDHSIHWKEEGTPVIVNKNVLTFHKSGQASFLPPFIMSEKYQ